MKIKTIIAAGLFAMVASFAAPSAIAEEAKQPAKEEKKEAVKPYKLDTCIVSDEKLDSMGEPAVMVYQGQEIKFCCKKCKPKFEKDPATYLKKLEGK